MNDKYTIKEISKLYNININTLFRNIQKNKIKTIPARKRGKKIQLIEKSEIEKFIGIVNSNEQDEVIQQNTIQCEPMKIEDFALYKLGKIESDYKYLLEKYETVLNENTELQEKIKVLPDIKQYNELQDHNTIKKNKAILAL